MNLLLINYEYPPIGGGAANAAWNIARELKNLGHTVTILTSCFRDLRGWKNENGIQGYRCRTVRKRKETSNLFEMLVFTTSAAFALPRILKKKRIQGAICFFSVPCGFLGLWGRMLFNIPYVVSLRGGDVPGADSSVAHIHRWLRPVRRKVLERSSQIVANSVGMKQIAQLTDPFPISVIPNGVDMDLFRPGLRKWRNGKFHFVYVGRFQPEKNLFFIIEQLTTFKQRNHLPFHLHMVGEGPQLKALKETTRSNGLTGNVTWHGWLDKNDLKKLYQKSDCMLMPSLYEGMSNAILEAMACGLPVIASRVGGNTDLVENGKTGYLFGLDCPDEFQSALNAVLKNREQSFRMGLQARRKISSEHNWKTVAQKYASIFNEPSEIHHNPIIHNP